MKNCIRLIALVAGCLFAVQASAQKSQPATVQASQPVSRPTTVTPAPDNNTVLLQYEKILNDDMKAHRDYVETLLKYLFYFIVFIGVSSSSLLVFFGRKSFREWKRQAIASMDELYRTNSSTMLDAHLQAKTQEMEREMSAWRDKVTADFKTQIEQQVKALNDEYHATVFELSGKMSSLGNLFRELAMKIPSRSTIRKSRVSLRYLTADGSILTYEKYQELVCESEKDPVSIVLDSLAINQSGKITEIDAGDPKAVIIQGHQSNFNITYSFNPPMAIGSAPFIKNVRCKLLDAFTADKEWLVISQITPCRDEQYSLYFLKERPCLKMYLEKLDFDGEVFATVYDGVSSEDTDTGQVFTMIIPVQDPPYKYRIVWEF
jgi:hypothetical protein